MRRLPLIGVLLSTGLTAQHSQYVSDSQNPAIGNPKAIAAGAALWATSCTGCHGADGSGGRGPNLVRRALWHPISDESIYRTIRQGVPGTDMPNLGVTRDEARNIAAYLESLQ